MPIFKKLFPKKTPIALLGFTKIPDFIEKYIDKGWNWGYLSKNPNITLEFIERYIYSSWCGSRRR